MDALQSLFTATISDLQQEFASQLALRTSLTSFNHLPLELDNGKSVNLQYLAQVSMKNPRQVHVNLSSNPQYLPKVRDALQSSSFNVNPRIEGTSIFIETPRVTREHREKLVKSAKRLGDEHKNRIRDTQNSKLKVVKSVEKMFSKDAVRKLQDDILKMGKDFNKQIDDAVKQKQTELLKES
ncbi:ribosome-recycling factor, mitochondrial-like isoform X2 [Watersipora subatra]